MQKANASAIVNIYDAYNSKMNGEQALNFGPVAEGETNFANYTDLENRGLFARLIRFSSRNMERVSELMDNYDLRKPLQLPLHRLSASPSRICFRPCERNWQ
jgi:hypothetical protein